MDTSHVWACFFPPQSIQGETGWQNYILGCSPCPPIQAPPTFPGSYRPILPGFPGEPLSLCIGNAVPLVLPFSSCTFLFLSPCSFCNFPQLRVKRFRQFQSRSWEKLSMPIRISRLLVMTGCVHTQNSLGTSIASSSSLFHAGGLCFSATRTSSHQFFLCWVQFCQVSGILQPEQWPQANLVQSM